MAVENGRKFVSWVQAGVALLVLVGTIGGYVLGLSNKLAVLEERVDRHISQPVHSDDIVRQSEIAARLAKIETQLIAIMRQLDKLEEGAASN